MASLGVGDHCRLAVNFDAARLRRGDAEDGLRDIGAARADKPAKADDLALADLEG